MDEKMFECVVCLEMCNECINCIQCNQILCKGHVPNLGRCPACRDEPFRWRENVAMQRIISQMRNRLGIAEPPPSAVEAGAAPAATTSATATAIGESTASAWGAFAASAVAATTFLFPNEDAEPAFDPNHVNPQYGSKVPCSGRREGELKKVPTDQHHAVMTAHTRTCTHGECRSVWSGPWGSFIGGAQGSTHFDLTSCTEGQRLNQLTGWNYEDPRH